jgi:hypothetical protein
METVLKNAYAVRLVVKLYEIFTRLTCKQNKMKNRRNNFLTASGILSAHLILPDLVTAVTFFEEHRLWSPLLCSAIQTIFSRAQMSFLAPYSQIPAVCVVT